MATYAPARPVNNSGVGGETTAQLLARVAADRTQRRWTTIFMDRPNDTGETWIVNLKAAATLLHTDRWFVVPPVLMVLGVILTWLMAAVLFPRLRRQQTGSGCPSQGDRARVIWLDG